MSKSERFARILVKRTSLPNLSATTAPSNDHTLLPTWETTDIYKGEFYINLLDEKLWIRTDHGIRKILFEDDASGTDNYVTDGDYNSDVDGGTITLNRQNGQVFITGLTSGSEVLNYINSDSTPETVGGIVVGSSFPSPGNTTQEMWDKLLYPYQEPTFNTFDISTESLNLEIGESFSVGTFIWTNSNITEVVSNSIEISGYYLNTITGLNVNSSVNVTFTGSVTSVVPSTRSWYIQGTDTNSGTFSKTHSIRWDWRWYWGTSSSIAFTNDTEIKALTNSNLYSSYSRTYSFGLDDYKYLCFADIYGGPSNFVDEFTGIGVAMYGGYTNFDNGYSYDLVSVTTYGETIDYRVYRSHNLLSSDINIIVT
jgi:hypothetical protein